MKCCCVLRPPPLVGLILSSPQPKPSSHGNEWHVGSPPGSHHPTPGLSGTLSRGNPSVPSHGALPLTRGSHAVGQTHPCPVVPLQKARALGAIVGSKDSLPSASLQLPRAGWGGHSLACDSADRAPPALFTPSIQLSCGILSRFVSSLHCVFMFYSVSLLCLFFFVTLLGMWNLSSPTRD